MKKIVLLTLLLATVATVPVTFAQGQKTDKKETRSDVKDYKAEKKADKGKMRKSANKETRSEVKDNKSDKKDIKNK